MEYFLLRCPHCATDNDDGLALCQNCNTPLTSYAGQGVGYVSKETLEKAAKLRIRPQVVPVMVIYAVLIALFGPIGSLLGKIAGRSTLDSEGTNYMAPAFGAVGIAFSAMFMIPLAAAILFLAWGVWAQRTWAWTAGAFLLGIVILMGLTGMIGGMARIIAILSAIIVAALWFRRDCREWFGAY
jgi:hypothetical protein